MVSKTQDLTTFSQNLFGGNLLQEDSLNQMLTFVETPEGYSYGLKVMGFDVPGLGVIPLCRKQKVAKKGKNYDHNLP